MIYADDEITLEWERSTIPWLKLFTVEPYREMSDLPDPLRRRIFELLTVIEQEMRDYFHPHKINLASFGNYCPHLHWHIMARYENDSHFPEPMWGERRREGNLELPDFATFERILHSRLSALR
ncbi:HIT family protein [Nitratifractor sp.]